jgi:hypothetical protein
LLTALYLLSQKSIFNFVRLFVFPIFKKHSTMSGNSSTIAGLKQRAFIKIQTILEVREADIPRSLQEACGDSALSERRVR